MQETPSTTNALMLLLEAWAWAWAALDHACAMGEAVAIVGYSLGATLGLQLAAARPADVVAVVA